MIMLTLSLKFVYRHTHLIGPKHFVTVNLKIVISDQIIIIKFYGGFIINLLFVLRFMETKV